MTAICRNELTIQATPAILAPLFAQVSADPSDWVRTLTGKSTASPDLWGLPEMKTTRSGADLILVFESEGEADLTTASLVARHFPSVLLYADEPDYRYGLRTEWVHGVMNPPTLAVEYFITSPHDALVWDDGTYTLDGEEVGYDNFVNYLSKCDNEEAVHWALYA